MPVQIRQVLDIPALNHQLGSPTGGVMRDMLRRGLRVQMAAKRNVRADHGVLRNSIMVGTEPGHGLAPLIITVGTTNKYAYWVHNGTGIYGPAGMPIVPVRASVLRFTTRQGTVLYRPSVKGQTPNPFLKDAMIAAKG